MNPRICLALLALGCAARAAEPAPPKDFVLGQNITLHSNVLGEKRALRIFTPASYNSAKDSYPTFPVLYLLDGTDHYVHVTGLVDYLARKGRIPPMIVVAIGNTKRTRDLTPTHTLRSANGKEHDALESSGGAGKFFEFIRDELIPYVERNYRVAPFRILNGHSFGGLFAIKVLLESPQTFQAYVAVSPSLWWDQQVMLKSSGPIGGRRQYLYLSVGNEGGAHRQSIDQFAAQLKMRAVDGLTWGYKPYEDESHGSVPHQTLYDSLKLIFAGWHLPDRGLDEMPLTYADAVQHYRALSAKYGYEVPLPLEAIESVAWDLAFHERWDAAIAAYQEAVRLYPKAASAQTGLGDTLARKGDKVAAIAAYQRALELNPKNSAAKKALTKLQPAAKAP